MCQYSDFDRLELDPWYRATLKDELPIWHKYPVTQNGTVLDIGAGQGETTLFYLNHGAARIIAVESDPASVEKFKHNFPDTVIIPKTAKIVLVEGFIDNVKIDIEGKERGLILETHFPIHWKRIWAPIQPIDVNLWRLDQRWFPFLNIRRLVHSLRIKTAHKIRVVLDLFLTRKANPNH